MNEDTLAKKKIFETLKAKGMLVGYNTYSSWLYRDEPEKLEEMAKRKEFLEWQNSLSEKERADFEHCFGAVGDLTSVNK